MCIYSRCSTHNDITKTKTKRLTKKTKQIVSSKSKFGFVFSSNCSQFASKEREKENKKNHSMYKRV